MVTTPYVSTVSGNRLYLDEPKIIRIDIEDIAIGLSNICRFTGQVEDFYSVAQHACIVASIVPPQLQRAALGHDDSEAFLGDFIKPVKVKFPEFAVLEDKLSALIAAEFRIDYSDYAPIKRADYIALKTEKRDMLPNSQENWEYLNGFPVLKDRIEPLEPKAARALFMTTYYRLENLRTSQYVAEATEPCSRLLGSTQCIVSSEKYDVPADWVVMAAEKQIEGHKSIPSSSDWHIVAIDSTAPDAMHVIRNNLKKNAAAIVRVSEGVKLEMATQLTDRQDQAHISGLVPRRRMAALEPYIRDLQGRNYEDMMALAMKAKDALARPMPTPELIMPNDELIMPVEAQALPPEGPASDGNRSDNVVSRLLKFRL